MVECITSRQLKKIKEVGEGQRREIGEEGKRGEEIGMIYKDTVVYSKRRVVRPLLQVLFSCKTSFGFQTYDS